MTFELATKRLGATLAPFYQPPPPYDYGQPWSAAALCYRLHSGDTISTASSTIYPQGLCERGRRPDREQRLRTTPGLDLVSAQRQSLPRQRRSLGRAVAGCRTIEGYVLSRHRDAFSPAAAITSQVVGEPHRPRRIATNHHQRRGNFPPTTNRLGPEIGMESAFHDHLQIAPEGLGSAPHTLDRRLLSTNRLLLPFFLHLKLILLDDLGPAGLINSY